MNRAQMRHIEPALDWLPNQLADTVSGCPRLERREGIRVVKPRQILKNGGSGIDVRIRTSGHATPRLPRPLLRKSGDHPRSLGRSPFFPAPVQDLPCEPTQGLPELPLDVWRVPRR